MRLFPAMAVIVMAGFCRAGHPPHDLSDTSPPHYRCPVKDKFLSHANAFDAFWDLNSWQTREVLGSSSPPPPRFPEDGLCPQEISWVSVNISGLGKSLGSRGWIMWFKGV